MMEDSVRDVICNRKSVRTYNGVPIRTEDIKKLEEYMETLKNPFGIPIEFRILDAKREGLSSPVVLGADTYVGAKVPRIPNSEIAFGYDFERFVFYAHSLGLGTVWLAATINRPSFEKAMEVRENEVMPAVTPIGYPASKRSVRETPSAGNKQPWRIVICGDTVHFYEKKAKSLSQNPLGDIQKVDVGIALLHFVLMAEEAGMSGSFLADNPKLNLETDMEYIIPYRSKLP